MGRKLNASCIIHLATEECVTGTYATATRIVPSARMRIYMLFIAFWNIVKSPTLAGGSFSSIFWVKNSMSKNAIRCAITADKDCKWYREMSHRMLVRSCIWSKKLRGTLVVRAVLSRPSKLSTFFVAKPSRR